MTESREGDSGWEPPEGDGLGVWRIRVPGGPAFAASAVTALSIAARDAEPGGPRHTVLTRLIDAFVEAGPESGLTERNHA